ncbi:serine/threonine-protein kinase [Nonomuraea zeae]|uniref:Serine/threonine protein kinase n=1 Tax=Nonomuraea zeae TaxID=1642303 RepID=A0A5S4G7S2_9ACTN|nr:serine/threonine-protein kinase [Nonomuraea zeae]TMR29068.1 serine/threonine protein kinase [Nonomuraea zeae]
MSTQTQEHLGPYRLIGKIGEGGMGVVHLGLDGAGREVAVKVLHPHVAADLKARDRLLREVETMRRVRSRYVAEVIDAELTGGRPYVVTRFAAGRTLEDTVLSEGPLEAREVIELARGLCQALVDVHAAGVIHRDLKPSNVMLVGGAPLVIDFGIAHLVDASRLTQSGMFVGTPGYLAPEIIRGSLITQAADVHALASTVFFAATGMPPFGTGTFEAVCFNTLEGRAHIDKAPAWLQGWLSGALQVDPAARPGARELLRLAEALDPAGRPRKATRLSERTLTMDIVSDLLPPVEYAPRSADQPPHAPTLHADRPAEHRPPPPPAQPFDLRRFLHGSGFVGVLMLVTLVALTVLMPVIVGLVAAALSLGLRAADHYFAESRPTLSRAALVAVGHLLLSLAFGIAAATALHVAGRLSTSHAESLAAGAFTLGLFVLPGAGAARRMASGLLARLLPGRSATVVTVAVMGPVALTSVIVALLQLL